MPDVQYVTRNFEALNLPMTTLPLPWRSLFGGPYLISPGVLLCLLRAVLFEPCRGATELCSIAVHLPIDPCSRCTSLTCVLPSCADPQSTSCGAATMRSSTQRC